jgi:hypothetical protein
MQNGEEAMKFKFVFLWGVFACTGALAGHMKGVIEVK